MTADIIDKVWTAGKEYELCISVRLMWYAARVERTPDGGRLLDTQLTSFEYVYSKKLIKDGVSKAYSVFRLSLVLTTILTAQQESQNIFYGNSIQSMLRCSMHFPEQKSSRARAVNGLLLLCPTGRISFAARHLFHACSSRWRDIQANEINCILFFLLRLKTRRLSSWILCIVNG